MPLSPKGSYAKRGAQQLAGRHRNVAAEHGQRIVHVLLVNGATAAAGVAAPITRRTAAAAVAARIQAVLRAAAASAGHRRVADVGGGGGAGRRCRRILVEQYQNGQRNAIEHLDALVKVAVHHAHQMRKGQAAEDPPAPVHVERLAALAGTDALQVRRGRFLPVNTTQNQNKLSYFVTKRNLPDLPHVSWQFASQFSMSLRAAVSSA